MTMPAKVIKFESHSFPKTPSGAVQALQALVDVGNGRTIKGAVLTANVNNKYLESLVTTAVSADNFYVRLTDKQMESVLNKKGKKGHRREPKGSGKKNYKAFNDLLDKLCNREATGNAARDAVDAFLMSKKVSLAEATFYMRVLNHDLRVGVADYRNWWPNIYEVDHKKGDPTYYGCMLADKVQGEHQQVLPCYADRKMDGIRVTIVSDKNGAEGFTRQGNSYPALRSFMERIHKSGFRGVLDVECMALNWNETSSLLRTQKNETKEWAKRREKELFLHVFDCLPLDEYYRIGKLGNWSAKKNPVTIEIPYSKRRKAAKKAVKKIGFSQIILATTKKIKTEAQLKKFYKKVLQEGFEGLMLKDPKGFYAICGPSSRPSFWMKLKPEDEVTLRIVALLEGQGNNRGKLGAFKGVTLDGKKTFKVGGGFKKDEREKFWKMGKRLIGKKFDAKLQDESNSQAKIIARFPVYARMRDDI